MRTLIAALQVSLDGFIEGPAGEIDWIDTWEDPFEILSEVDTLILGGGMYPGYEQYWGAILADPRAVSPFTGKAASDGEVAYARYTERTPHVVLSTTLRKVGWTNTRIVRNIGAIRQLKQESGGSLHAVGGAALVASLMNEGLVDELRLVVHPIVLGGGKALFEGVHARHPLDLVAVRPMEAGKVYLQYRARPNE